MNNNNNICQNVCPIFIIVRNKKNEEYTILMVSETMDIHFHKTNIYVTKIENTSFSLLIYILFKPFLYNDIAIEVLNRERLLLL